MKGCLEVLEKKNHDYTTETWDENFQKQAIIVSWFKRDIDKVFAGMMAVKLARLSALLQDGKEPNYESIIDTFQDMANYAVLWGGIYAPPPYTSGRNEVERPRLTLADELPLDPARF